MPDASRKISLRILGPLGLTDQQGEELRRVLTQPKRLALIAFLVLARRGGFCRRDTVTALFWPELDQARARSALRQALSWLRRNLGDDVVLTRGEEEIGVAGPLLVCDAVLFEEACDADRPEDAIELYRGDLLDGVFVAGGGAELEQWIEGERTRLRKRATQAIWSVAGHELAAGHAARAVAWGQRAAALSPHDEGEFRRLIRLFISADDRAGALEAYQRFRDRLRADYEAEPSAETQRLLAEVRSSHEVAVPGTLAGDRFAPPRASLAATRAPPLAPVHGGATRRSSRALLVLAGSVLTAVLTIAIAWQSERGASPPNLHARVIAVLPFIPNQPDSALSRLGRDLAATISASLDGMGPVRTPDWLAALALARECGEECSPAQSDKLAQTLGAEDKVQGVLLRAGNGIRVEFTLSGVGQSKSAVRGSITLPGEDLSALTDSVAWALLSGLWKTGEPPSPSLASVTTRSLPALRAFLDGEVAVVDGNFPAAATDFRNAMAADPRFWLAYLRLHLALSWTEEEIDPALLDSLSRHRGELSVRDRMLVEALMAWQADRVDLALQVIGDATQRFPDHWPAWFMYADWLTHFGGLNGYPREQARAAWQHALRLNPGLIAGWSHLFLVSVGEDTLTADLALRRLRQLGWFERPPDQGGGSEAWFSLMDALGRTGGRVVPSIVPLIERVAHRVEVPPGPGSFDIGPHGALYFGFPAAQIQLEQLAAASIGGAGTSTASVRRRALAWAARGAWDSALVLLDEYVRDSSAVAPALERYRLSVIAAWLGVVDPSAATTRRLAVPRQLSLAPPSSMTERQQALLHWLDGLLAFRIRDREGLLRARASLERLSLPGAAFNRRSLAAFARALDGDSVTAGRELAALEWTCAREVSCELGNYDISVHHLAAANWLLQAGDTLEAERLLVWNQAWQSGRYWSGTEVLGAIALLRQAQIAEAQGDLPEALRDYGAFLRRMDRPDPALSPLVQQAEAAAAGLRLPAAVQRYSETTN